MENSKSKKCRYCNTNIIWDDSIKKYNEVATQQIHTTDRCSIQMPKTGTLEPVKLDSSDSLVKALREISIFIDKIQSVAYESTIRNHPSIKPESRDFGPIVSKRTDQILECYLNECEKKT